ncbi:MAG: hypothetical protein IJB68_05540 [Ruminococcus sp.]|nr:hypothetical protein [Ruminococcus sp.]
MNTQKLPLLIGFNLILAAVDVILLSRGITSLSSVVRIIIIIASVVIFLAGNYFILSVAYKKPVVKDRENADYDDFEEAFKGWKGMNTPYNRQIDKALRQLNQFNTRREKLKALSEDSTFDAAIDEVQAHMFSNFNRIINRLLIFDKNDNNDINRNGNYINKLLMTNEQYLDVFRKFIDEISLIGDSSDGSKTLSLQTITESLREIRTNGEADKFDDIG